MSLSSEDTTITLVANNTAGFAYTVALRIIDVSHIKVYKKTTIGGVWELVSSALYTVALTGIQGSTQATVTFPAAQGSSNSLKFVRIVPATQPFEYTVSGPFPAKSHEDGLDRLAMCVQQMQTAYNSSLVIDPISNTLGQIKFAMPSTVTASLFGLEVSGGVLVAKSYTSITPSMLSYVTTTTTPTSTDIPDGRWGVHFNSVLNQFTLCANFSGSLKKVQLI